MDDYVQIIKNNGSYLVDFGSASTISRVPMFSPGEQLEEMICLGD